MKQDLKINLHTKAITLLEDMTVLKLHRRLQDLADQDDLRPALTILDPSPSIRHTDNIIELKDTWYVVNPERLFEGSIIQRGGVPFCPNPVPIGPVKL